MKKKKMIAISSLLLVALLLAAGYLWIRTDVPEMEFHYRADEVYADWRLDKDGTVTVYGNGRLTWFKAEYSARLLRLSQEGSLYAYLKWHLGKGYIDFPAKKMIIKGGVTGLRKGEFMEDNHSFDSCYRLREIIVDENNRYLSSENGVLFNKDKTVLLSYPKGKTDRSYTVPDGVRTISVEAFIDNARLSSVILPEGLTEIKYNAFCNCSRLTEISLPDGLTTVEAYAFVHCRRLKTVAVPAGVQLIDEYAFGFYHGGRMENYELARVKGFRLLYDDDVAVVKDYAQKYGIALDSKEVST